MGDQLAYTRCLWFDSRVRQHCYPNAPDLAREFEVSERTARRTIEFMQLHLGAPLRYDPQRRGYVYEEGFTLPDLPVSQEELLAILLARNLLTATDNGFIGQAIQRFGRKLLQKNGQLGISGRRLRQCFSALWHGYAPAEGAVFRTVSQALLADRPLAVRYRSPQVEEISERVVEPHHLQHYMGSWVLLAWCRLRNDWRRFYLARIERAAAAGEPFARRPVSAWRHLLAGGFGIFQGEELFPVTIRFTPRMARWIREQVWHPDQTMATDDDGSLILTVPAADLREIRMKVLQFGAEAEVVTPEELRRSIGEEATRVAALYGG
ncbi:MAG: WYL domain-containing protein [Thermodesulfobacteriota bacterium]